MMLRVLLLAFGLLLFVGQNAYAQFPARCIDVLVTVEGGGGQVVTCEGDGIAETINFSATSLAMPVSFLITDENDIILKVSVRGMLTFEGLGVGTFRVYAFSWLGQITARQGQNATTAGLGSFCGNLSDNFITVTNFTPDGGAVSTDDGSTSVTVCVGDGVPDVVNFTTTASAPQNYAYIITDENNIVITVPSGDSFDFDGAGAGISHVWGISYAGNLTAMVGDTVGVSQLSDNCFGLSENFIEVIRSQPDGGTVELTNGETTATVCVGDGQDDILSFTNQTSSPAAYTFIITDENNIILDIPDGNSANFEGAGAGISRIWGLSYTGNLTAAPGGDAAAVALSDDCFELSENFIEVIRQEADGGAVALDNGDTDAVACVGDGSPDIFNFTNTSVGADNYTYLITDEDNIILAIDDDGSFDFEGADVGICRVWGLAYGGALLAQVGDDAAAALLADGCYGLSDNFITIRRESVDGGTVSMPGGETITYTCPGDGNPDIVMFTNTGSGTGSYAYVVTDEDNIILAFPAGDSFDFDGAPAGACRVWGLAYTGNVTAMVGDDAAAVALTDECFDLSDNFITVVRETPEGGTVQMPNGETTVYTCPGDGNPDIVMFDSTGTSSGPYAYVVTDEDNIILAFPAGDSFDFDGAPAGACRVWGLAYTGNVTAMVGDDAAAVALTDECFDLSDNFITVVRETPEGGTVQMPNGETTVYTCPGDGNPDIVMFDSTGTSSGPYAYVVTDEDNIILAFPAGDSFDFDGAPAGTCRVWGLAYTGNVTAMVGDDAAAVALSDDCFGLSDNFITVIRQQPDGGTVSLSDGTDLAFTCPGDGNPDILMFDSTGTAGPSFTYVITDEQNIILDVPAGDSFDFDGAPAGICRVWGLAYTGNLTAMVGDTASTAVLTDDCYDLSDNFIAVVRQQPQAGLVEMPNGETTVYTCPGDGTPDIVMFDSIGAGITPFTYVITDENNIILDIPAGDSFDFDGAPAGTCRAWGLAYTGNLTAMVGDDASAVALSDDCYDLSDNFITVIREVPEGGTVQMPNGETIVYTCPGDGTPDIVMFDSTGTSGGPYAYVVTDEDNNILAFPAGDSFDFDGAPAGACRVWGLAYTGNVTAMVGDNAAAVALSDDCFSLSANFITVIREVPEGGTVATEDGGDEVTICPGDGNPDIVRFDSSGTAGQYVYVVTDEDNIILALSPADSVDFDMAGIGVSRVWGLAYTGSITAVPGDDAAAVALSDDCFDLSDNFITVIREVPEGGTVAMPDGNTIRYTCPGDGNPDVVQFDSTGADGLFAYVITDDDNNILALPPGDSFDFEDAPPGECRVWGLAYSGTIIAQVGQNAATAVLTTDCWDLSDNYITIIRDVPVGGTVSLPNGDETRFICPGDGTPDIVEFDSSGTVGQYIYVITDEDNDIIALPDGDSYDFDSSPLGECRVYGLAYTGNLTGELGDNVLSMALSDDCFELSGNYITIIKETPEAGTIGTLAGPVSLDICVGDAVPDSVTFIVNGASSNNYIFVVTDENDFIISALDDPTFDFGNAQAGTYHIYGLAYTGQPVTIPGDNLFQVDLSTDCYDLTDNFVEIIATGVDGATIFTNVGVGVNEINLCVGDGVADELQFTTTTSALSASYTFAITNENDVVIGFLPASNSFNFELTGPGIAKVWGISYTGNLTLNVGQVITAGPLSDGCYDISDNVITVVRDFPEGGLVSTDDGEDDILVCITPDGGVVDFTTTSTTVNPYVYLLTDTNFVILDVYEDGAVDFAQLAEDDYLVIGLSYTGMLNNIIGEDAVNGVLSTSCFDISDNFVYVVRGPEVNGGEVSAASGLDTIFQCPGDGVADLVQMQTSSQDLVYRYIITNTNNRVIVPEVINPVIDFEGAAPGAYRVWGVSITGPVTIGFNDNLLAVPVSEDCYQLSANFITVIREAPEGGTVFTSDTSDAVSVVVGDGVPDEVSFISLGASNSNFVYVITDEDNVIIDTFTGDTFDFEGAAPGVCRVWGLAYTGNLLAMPGDTANIAMLTDDCWDLSDNFVTVTRLDGPQRPAPVAGQPGAIQSMEIAPNPAVDYAVVRFTLSADAEPVSTLRIMDGNGRMLQAERVASLPGENRYEVQVGNWAGGLYVAYLINGTEIKARKLMVARR